MTTPCPACRCSADSPAHAIAGALALDDLDRAMAFGLLQATACPRCSEACRSRVVQARDARRVALDARERYRARQARMARREAERAARRRGPTTPPDAAGGTDARASGSEALPPAAAAALARALARAGGKPR